jgi:hypothetical protein
MPLLTEVYIIDVFSHLIAAGIMLLVITPLRLMLCLLRHIKLKEHPNANQETLFLAANDLEQRYLASWELLLLQQCIAVLCWSLNLGEAERIASNVTTIRRSAPLGSPAHAGIWSAYQRRLHRAFLRFTRCSENSSRGSLSLGKTLLSLIADNEQAQQIHPHLVTASR